MRNILGLRAVLASGLAFATPAQVISDRVAQPKKLSEREQLRIHDKHLPSGYSGAKLARKALKGTVGKAAIR